MAANASSPFSHQRCCAQRPRWMPWWQHRWQGGLRRAVVGLLAASSLAAASLVALPVAASSVAQAHTVPMKASRNVIRIAVLNDQSGPYRSLSGEGSIIAAQMAVADAGGAVDGVPVEIVSADHKNDPVLALELLRGWLAEPKGLDMVVDVPNSSVALAVQQMARERGLVHINVSAAAMDLSGESCAETGFQWGVDTYALSVGLGPLVVQRGGTRWFFLTADYVFGHQLQRDTLVSAEHAGGDVVGSQLHPFPAQSFDNEMKALWAADPSVVAFANAGRDLVGSVQAVRRTLPKGKTLPTLVGLLVFSSDIDDLGLSQAQGMVMTSGWYWDLNEASRAFAQRFAQRSGGKMPTMTHAGTYSAVRHYLTAVDEARSDRGYSVAEAMRRVPVDDFYAGKATVRDDGRLLHAVYLTEVKSPAESHQRWDTLKVVGTVPASAAFPEHDGKKIPGSRCPLLSP